MAELIGFILALDAIITWSLASLVYKSGLGKTNAKGTLLFRLCIVSIATFLMSLIFGSYLFFESLTEREFNEYMIMCLLSGLGVTIGDLMYFTALKKIDASRAFPLTQLSLIFVYPFAFFFFGEEITIPIIIGGALILSSVFFLSSPDKKEDEVPENEDSLEENNEEKSEDLIMGVLLATGTAFLWAISMVTFHQARIITGDVFVTNFLRIFMSVIFVAILGIFNREYFIGFSKEERGDLKYYFYIGFAGSLSLGLADSLFFKAAEINGLVLTSTITANTPMVQQLFAIFILKEKFRKRFLIAVVLIIIGNYLILFL